MQTSLSTLVNGEVRFLGVGKYVTLEGHQNSRNIYLTETTAPLTISRPSWAPAGKIYIGIRGLRGADGRLVPAWAIAGPNRGMLTHADKKEQGRDKSLWTPEHAEGGQYYFRYMDTTLFLAISADGYPTLSETAAPWRMGPVESVDLTAF